MVKMFNFMLCVFYHNFLIKKKFLRELILHTGDGQAERTAEK